MRNGKTVKRRNVNGSHKFETASTVQLFSCILTQFFSAVNAYRGDTYKNKSVRGNDLMITIMQNKNCHAECSYYKA